MNKWIECYNLAKAYYEHHGNLIVSRGFITINGYEEDPNGVNLGEWISTQRKAYKGKSNYKITQEQIKLLEDIGIKWFSENVDNRLQNEEITEKNTLIKQKEIINRLYSLFNKHNEKADINKEDINNEFMNQLDNKTR